MAENNDDLSNSGPCTRRKRLNIVEPLYKSNKFVMFKELKELITGQKFQMINGKQSMTFTLTPHYVHKILASQHDGTFRYEVQLNVWNYRTTEEWDDIFLYVDVNNMEAQSTAQASPHLIYLTSYCFLRAFTTNTITISCPRPEMLDDYAFSLCIVQRMFPVEIILNNPVGEVGSTIALVRNEIVGHGIYDLFLEFPDTGYIIRYPCRSIFCTHPEVFDLMLYLNAAQFYQQWICPICAKLMKYEDIVLDVFLKRKVDDRKTRILFYKRRLNARLTDNVDDDIQCELELITIQD